MDLKVLTAKRKKKWRGEENTEVQAQKRCSRMLAGICERRGDGKDKENAKHPKNYLDHLKKRHHRVRSVSKGVGCGPTDAKVYWGTSKGDGGR